MTPDTQSRLTALRQDLHRHPDLSGDEASTATKIADILEALNPDEIVTGVGGHGVVARFNGAKPGPSLALRCELDALPIVEQNTVPYASERTGIAHLCGHDGHMVILLAVAEHLAQNRPERGQVALIFQPAEETGQGAAAVCADPRFARNAPDIMLALHNLPGVELGHVELCTGPANCASRGLVIRLSGKTSHAAAPQDGLSPASAMVRLMPALARLGPGGALNSDYALTTLTHARLGDATFGVAPGEAEIWITLRTVTDARMDRLLAEAQQLAQSVADTAGLGVEFRIDDVFDACINHGEAVALLHDACVAENVPVRLTSEPQRFSEDFGQFGATAHCAMFWLGAGTAHPQLHNPDYDFPDAVIPVGVSVFLRVIRSVLG